MGQDYAQDRIGIAPCVDVPANTPAPCERRLPEVIAVFVALIIVFVVEVRICLDGVKTAPPPLNLFEVIVVALKIVGYVHACVFHHCQFLLFDRFSAYIGFHTAETSMLPAM